MKKLILILAIYGCCCNSICAQSNVDLELGNFNNWTTSYTTQISNTPIYPTTPFPIFEIVSGHALDSISGLPMVCPNGGNYSIRIGNLDSLSANTAKRTASISLILTPNNYMIKVYHHFISSATQHSGNGNSKNYFKINNNGASLIGDMTSPPCCIGYPSGYPNYMTVDSTNTYVYSNAWQCYTGIFPFFIGQTITLDLVTENCMDGGHTSYSYFDIALEKPEIKIECDTNNTYKLIAPEGYLYYYWTDNYNHIPQIVNSNAINIPTANLSNHTYTCKMTSRYICGPFSPQIDSLTFVLPNDFFTTKITAKASDTSICLNDSILVYGTNGSNYTWNMNTMDSVYFTPNQSQHYILTGLNKYKCNSVDSIAITVNNSTNINASYIGNNIVCKNDSIALTGNFANQIIWNNNYISNVPFAINQTDTFYAQLINSFACKSFDTLIIFVHNNPIFSVAVMPNDTVCAGDSVKLFGIGNYTYTWNQSINNNQYFTINNTTQFNVIATDSNACKSNKNIEVAVLPIPTIQILATPNDTVCSFSFITLNAISSGQITWSNGVQNGTTFEIFDSTKTFYVNSVDSYGCRSIDSITIVVFICESVPNISNFDDTKIRLYPNPSNDFIFFENNKSINFTNINIVDVLGKTVNNKISITDNKIDIRNLTNGVYSIYFKSDKLDKSQYANFVKQ